MTSVNEQNIAEVLRRAVPDLTAPPGRLDSVARRVRRRRNRRLGVGGIALAAALIPLAVVWSAPHSHRAALVAAPVAGPPSRCPAVAEVRPDVYQAERPVGEVLGPGFTPVSGVMCTLEPKLGPDGSVYQTLVERHAVTGLDRLASELRKPSATAAPPGVGCTLMGDLIAWFALTDASGRTVRPVVPAGECGHPSPEAMKALADAGWRTVSERRVSVLEPAAARRAGCASAHKDLSPLAAKPVASDNGLVLDGASRQVTACVYTSGTGVFASGGKLTGAKLDAVRAALNSASAARPCDRRARSFVHLSRDEPTHIDVYAELGGCHRVLRDDGKLAQLAPSEAARFESALPH